LLLSTSAFAQQRTQLQAINVTTTSARQSFISGAGGQISLFNDGPNQAYYTLGNASVTASTGNIPLPPGCSVPVDIANNLAVAAITSVGTTTLRITQGTNVPAPSCSSTSASQALTNNRSILIAVGNTYQQISPSGQNIKSLTIQNNNTITNDSCWIDVSGAVAVGNQVGTNVTVGGATMTSAQASIFLAPGGSYGRYFPFVPSGPIVGTCGSAGDSIYVDWQ